MTTNFEHCAALVREADRDRYLATLFAPARHRDALFALYAFNVEISRVRDLAREPMPGEIRLQWWREALGGERDSEAAAHPVAAALRETLARHKIASDRLIALIDAHSFDLYDEPMLSFAELQGYAARTTGVVFELAIQILGGAMDSVVVKHAGNAGYAHAIANILTRLPIHSSRRQLYVPLEALHEHGAREEDFFALQPTKEVRGAVAAMWVRARGHLASVSNVGLRIPQIAWPAFLPLAPLRPLLFRMSRPDYDPFRPAHVSLVHRQWRIWRAAKNLSRMAR